ncbi:hypothetical protein EON64_04415 [archaeon]|nr:MAG: hypothetical protein EON64_04415 [archaeon]
MTTIDLTALTSEQTISFESQKYEDAKAVVVRQQPGHNVNDLSGLVRLVTNVTLFPNLIEVTIAYVQLTQTQFSLLCDTISSRMLDCLWRKVSIIRCQLHALQIRQFFQAINGNPRLESINVTGNKCDEAGIKLLMHACTNPENLISSLFLNSCHLTPHCLLEIASNLHNSKFQIRDLHLSDNPYMCLDNAVLDRFFESLIVPNLSLQELHLAAGNMRTTTWSRYLPFIHCLQHLDLSRNDLDDDSFILLSITVSQTHCLTYLDLSYNAFCSSQCASIEQLLSSNQSLHYLSLAGHEFDSAVLRGILHGLRANKSLLTLDLTDCDLTPDNMTQLAPLFQHNNLVSLVLEQNHLSDSVMQDARGLYCQHDKEAFIPLSTRAPYDAMAHAKDWREKVKAEVRSSISSLSGSEDVPINPVSHNMFTCLLPLVQRSSYYYSEADMQRILADAHKAHSSTNIYIDIVLGRREGLLLGSVQIHGLTTYEMIRMNVFMLIKDHTKTGGVEALQEYKEFLFLNVDNKAIDEDDLKVSHIANHK